MRSSRRTAVIGLVLSLATLVAVPTVVALREPAEATIGQRPPVGQPFGAVDAAAGPGQLGRTAPSSEPSLPESAPVTPAVLIRPAVAPRRTVPDAPRQLVLPAVGLDVPVGAVGVAPDGSMAIPTDVNRAGWYRFGPAPGQPGSVVLVGHVDSRTQGLGAFARLAAVEVGDRVLVSVRSGRTYTYRVVARELLPKRSLPTEELWSRSGSPRLTLITCGGPYDPDRGGYQDNLVVTAVPVPVRD